MAENVAPRRIRRLDDGLEVDWDGAGARGPLPGTAPAAGVSLRSVCR